MERLNTQHHTRQRNTPKYTPEVRDGSVIPAYTHTHKRSKIDRTLQNIKTKIHLRAHTSCYIVPASPSSKVATTCPAVFMIAAISSRSPAAKTIIFWTNWGGPD